MSAPHSSGANNPQNESLTDGTQLEPDVGDAGATLAEDVPAAASPSGVVEHTMVEPSELSEVTIVRPPELERGTMIDPGETDRAGPSAFNPESAVHTIVDPELSKDAEATFPEIQATAGSSSAARAWAPTKGATGSAWSGPKPPTSRPQVNALRAEDRYRLIEKFAQGGMGKISRAEDTSIHREIAFKELLPKALKNRMVVERFLEEAQITGQLEHPGIVPIYDVGYREDGTPFYAMKLVKGGNMEDAIIAMHALPRESTERQLAFTRLMRQFIAVCQAVGFAHEKGVLHRDLKPLNVMLGEFGETLVLDWGLAKVVDVFGEQTSESDTDEQLDSADANASDDPATMVESSATNDRSAEASGATRAEASLGTSAATAGGTRAGATNSSSSATSASGTQSSRTEAGSMYRRLVNTDARTAGSQTMMGQIMGTPAYMPPEQAQGLVDQYDARTDIYSLGGILYRLLTNLPPVPRGKAQEVLVKVIAGQITPPREIDPAIPKPLEAICRKAMALQQDDRYAKAVDLAEDVERFLADEPVKVFPDSWLTKFRRWRKRHRSLVWSSTVAALVIGIGSFAWNKMEAYRVQGLQLAAHAKVRDAQSATEQADFVKANSLLTEALGQVQAETKLVQLRDYIQNDLDNVARLQAAAERERLTELRTKTERLLDDAQQASDTANDFAQARTLLTEAVTLLANESSLADLHREAQSRLAKVNQALAERGEVDAARAQLAKFDDAVEQVRVFGGNVSGEDSIDDLREARKHGLAALELFEIDFEQPEKLDTRLRLLGPEAIDSWKSGLLELLITIAQAETNLAIKDQPGDVTAAAKRSLQRVEQAEMFGLSSRPVGLLKADLLVALGNTEDAQKTLAEAELLSPTTRLDHYWLAERARRQRRFAQAILHLQDALQVDPNDFWSLYLMGFCYLNQDQQAAAVANFTACIARRPNLVWPYVSRAVALTNLKQFENAHHDLARAQELSPNAYGVLLNRGFVYLAQKNYAAAKADFAATAELRPDLAGPPYNLAETSRRQAEDLLTSNASNNVLRANAEFQTALSELTKALPLAPQQASLYHIRGRLRINLNDPAEALADFQRAVTLEPNPKLRAVSFAEIGQIHLRANRLRNALVAFDQSLAQNPNDTKVIKDRAEVLLTLGQLDESIAGFTIFLEKHGPDADSYRGRGSAYALSNKYREAINDYTMSLQFEPAPNMLKQRGKAYLFQATQLAREDFEESLRLNPIDPDSRWGLAHAMVMLGDHAGAVAEFEKIGIAAKGAAGQFGPREWPLLFNPATTYAQAYAKALIDPKLSAERRDELTKQYVASAVELLDLARRTAGEQFGSAFKKQLRTDADLNPIRQRPEFLEALKTLDRKP